jgi:P4 family phage/plasmid primase-like protien
MEQSDMAVPGHINPPYILSLHHMGFNLVPISSDGVTPTIQWGKVYESGWTEEELNKLQFTNIATCFGKSHLKDEDGRDLYLNCLDIDSEEVFTRLAIITDEHGKHRFLINELCQHTYVTKTRKKHGRHVYWLSHNLKPAIHSRDCMLGHEFEIKTDDTCGLAALPPSCHRADQAFHYHGIGKGNILISDKLYDIIIRILDDCTRKKEKQRSQNERVSRQLSEADVNSLCNLISPIYRPGYRHQICYSLSGLLHRSGIGLDSTSKIIKNIAKQDEELNLRLAVMRHTYSKDRNEVSGKNMLFEILASASNDASMARDILRSVLNTLDSHMYQGPDIDHNVVAEELISEFHFKTMTDTEEIYYYHYKTGRYRNRGEIIIKQQLELLYPNITTHHVREISQKISRRNPVDRSQFDSFPHIVSVGNGVLNVLTAKLFPHSPKFLILTQLPVLYNPKAKCPKILKFLGQVLRPCDVFTILQFIGYCLLKKSKYEKALLAIGKGDNGKSILLNLIEAFLGVENVSHVSLKDMNDDRFAKAELFGKMANTCGDLESHKILDISAFKQLASGDTVRAQEKNKNPFYFRNYAKLIFNSNSIPEVVDGGYAWFKRIIPIPFLATFLEDKNIDKIDEMTTPEELSGLLNLVLIALNKLIKDGHFAHIEDIRTVRQLFVDNKEGVSGFISEYCIRDYISFQPTASIYEAYLQYCQVKEISALKDNSLGAYLKEIGVQKERIMVSGVRTYIYKGIKLKPK